MNASKILIDVPYLEDGDITSDGNLKPSFTEGKPVLLLVQANFCPHCTTAKPDFQKLLDCKEKFKIATVQGDGDAMDKAASEKLSKNVRGFPTYLVFNRDGTFKEVCEAGRDYSSLKKYMGVL